MSDQNLELQTLTVEPPGFDSPLTGPFFERLGNDVLPGFLPHQRWFADKDAAVGSIRIVDTAALVPAQMCLAIVEIERSQRMYFVPLAVAEADAEAIPERAILAHVRIAERVAVLSDGFAVDELPLLLLDDVRAERRRPTAGGGEFVAHAAPALSRIELDEPTKIRRLSVEQSNTSIVLGEAIVLKAYRRVHQGPQPELEIARFLGAAEYRNTPALVGYIEYEHPRSEATALCILQRFVPSQGDGWAVTLAYVASFCTRAAGGQAHRDDKEAAFIQRIRTLGVRTAELHRAFATPLSDPAFEPEPTTVADLDAWIAQADATAAQALDSLEREIERLPDGVRDLARAVLARRAEITQRMHPAAAGALSVMKTRYHGDFHLGQVLVVGDDFMIVDFEGEPGRDASVRRQKSSPLRDVAGMLRSLNYAAVSGVTSVSGEGNAQGLAVAARDWEQRSVAAFLDGYRSTVEGCSSYPSDPEVAQRLLDLFTLEKALYEVSYELANRPAWLRIPLEGIRTILDAGNYASVN